MLSELGPAIFGSRLNLLLLFLPVAVALEMVHAGDVWVFAASALSIIPLAGLIGHATEDLARRVGPGIGGLLNATFGNGAELLIAGFALSAGLTDVVKASVAGSILRNTPLFLWGGLFGGGLGRPFPKFRAAGGGAESPWLFLGVARLGRAAVYAMTVLGDLRTSNLALDELSLATSLVLLGCYVAGLIFSLRTHADVFSEPELSGSGHASEEPHGMSTNASVLLLLVATVLTAIGAEILVGAVEGAARAMGMTDLFVGFIVVAVVGNAAEHFSAVVFARRDQMQLAINIAKDSSVQIALLVAPVLVLFSWVLGAPMNLVFHPFELFGLALAVFAVTFVSLDGESNWYEGLLLLALYVIVALATYFVPA